MGPDDSLTPTSFDGKAKVQNKKLPEEEKLHRRVIRLIFRPIRVNCPIDSKN